MNKKIFLAVLFFALASCSHATASPPSTGARTPAPTASLPAAGFDTPTASIPTQTPVIQTPVFIYPTEWPSAYNTLTPIPTPEISVASLRLRTWDESNAIVLIKEMDEYARKMDIPGILQSRGYYKWAQTPVELLLQETISRFPDSANSDAYQWHLAEVRAIMGVNDSNRWIASEIEKALRSEEVTMGSLNGFLKPHGFFANRIKGYNLFGDKKQGWVLQVTLEAGRRSDGLFLVVRQDENLKYIVYILGGYWSFTKATRKYTGLATTT